MECHTWQHSVGCQGRYLAIGAQDLPGDLQDDGMGGKLGENPPLVQESLIEHEKKVVKFNPFWTFNRVNPPKEVPDSYCVLQRFS